MEKPSREAFEGNNKLLIGIVLSVITFWLFAQSLVNVVPILEDSFNTDIGTVNIAVSITALFSGMFVVKQVVLLINMAELNSRTLVLS